LIRHGATNTNGTNGVNGQTKKSETTRSKDSSRRSKNGDKKHNMDLDSSKVSLNQVNRESREGSVNFDNRMNQKMVAGRNSDMY
jgi:hypothetical protein